MEIKIHLTWKKTLLTLVILFFVIVPLWAYFPIFFAKLTYWMLGDAKVYGDHLGAVGDIYGSLNTLISSIALCAVAFSTWLQVTSLHATRLANNEQIKQARDMHDSQMLESRKTILLNHFYNLLALKNEYLNTLILDNGMKKSIGNDFFDLMYKRFKELKRDSWKDLNQVTRNDLRTAFRETFEANNQNFYSGCWLSYFCIHTELNKILNNPDLSFEDKEFLRSILRNSMTPSEQGTLIWIASFSWRIASGLESSYICVHLLPDYIGDFAAKFLFKSFWGLEQIRVLVPLEHPQQNDYM